MLNTAKEVIDYIARAHILPRGTAIYTDVFPDEAEGIICRYDPSQGKTRSFLDGSRLCTQQLSLYARFKDAAVCREYLQRVVDLIDTACIETESGVCLDAEAATLPQFAETDEKNNTIYTAVITCEYTETPQGETI